MERRVASDILLNAFHERYSPFEKCAVKFSTVARIVRAESVAGKIYCESIRLSGNIWLVSFKISYLCLPLFYETRT
ncbi:hypothetical protein, partial [Bacteroides stercoris]|uniref:hypothetical protein n=1 Tax=Bacteroides stercoris TaxID=46506 RepID=UPI00359C8A9A